MRGADIKEPEFAPTRADEFMLVDLREIETCRRVTKDVDHVYHLAADMGGIGYITSLHATIALNDIRMNSQMLVAATDNHVDRFFYSSSACIYPGYLQDAPDVTPLKEDDAYPADAEPGYGWEKLFTELLCEYVDRDYGLPVRIARFHNVYGPLGTYDGGKEKAPAALCRKIAQAKDEDTIEVWGDGEQTRSFMHIDDCVKGIYAIMQSDYNKPLNLGRDEMVTVNQLVDIIAAIAKKKIRKRYNLKAPQGVRGRNSDNSLFKEVTGWAPEISLEEGLKDTYDWIKDQYTPPEDYYTE